MGIQSEEFGLNRTLPIESITYEHQNKDCNDVSNEANMKMDFNSTFSDESDHNAATTCEHMIFFIHWMYEDKLFITDGIMYDNTDGCSKQ